MNKLKKIKVEAFFDIEEIDGEKRNMFRPLKVKEEINRIIEKVNELIEKCQE